MAPEIYRTASRHRSGPDSMVHVFHGQAAMCVEDSSAAIRRACTRRSPKHCWSASIRAGPAATPRHVLAFQLCTTSCLSTLQRLAMHAEVTLWRRVMGPERTEPYTCNWIALSAVFMPNLWLQRCRQCLHEGLGLWGFCLSG